MNTRTQARGSPLTNHKPGDVLYSGPNVAWSGDVDFPTHNERDLEADPPLVLLLGPERCGKSALVSTLIDWPAKGLKPYVLAFDPNGPDTLRVMGYSKDIDVVKIRNAPGVTLWQKTQAVLRMLEKGFGTPKAPGRARAKYGSIIIDDFTTMVSQLLDEANRNPAARRNAKNDDPRAAYGDIYHFGLEFYFRLRDLHVATVLIGIVRDAESSNGKYISGGLEVAGQKLKHELPAKTDMVLLLEKMPIGSAASEYAETGDDGAVRTIHTKDHNGVIVGGRYQAILPDPCHPHLGWIFDRIMGREG